MAASTAGALKAKIEAAGLGLSAFRDEAPENMDGTLRVPPYVTIAESLSIIPEGHFNPIDDTTGHVSELVQVDLWEQWRDKDSRVITESMTKAGDLIRALHGARLTTAPKRVFHCDVDGSRRLLDRKANRVHTAITVRLRRVM